jgi:serine/threonine protein phosphatase PrpC
VKGPYPADVSGQLRVHFETRPTTFLVLCFLSISGCVPALRTSGDCGIVAAVTTTAQGDGEASDVSGWSVQHATLTDCGTERGNNEDACATYVEAPTHVLVAVADGVSGEEGGEIASRTAVDVTLRAYKDSPASWGALRRLYRAAQQANIEIHDRALVVTELRRMSTTLTAIVIEGGMLHGAHVGDSRLYLIRGGTIVQKTKDHTVAGERRRVGLISAERAKSHPDRSVLTRSLGRELIAAVDRLSFPVGGGDTLVVCSDGLYNVLEDDEVREAASVDDPEKACRALVDAANSRGTPDNVTVGVMKIAGQAPDNQAPGLRGLLAKWLGR